MSSFTNKKSFIPYNLPDITDAEIDEVSAALRSGWVAKGPRTVDFEKKFAEYLGVKYAVGVNSCTAALHTALIVSGVGPGDEVITTPMTFVSTVSTILHTGATPVFADIDYFTGCIDPVEIERKITPKTKAIVPVHYSGQVCDLDKIYDIADQHGLFVSEDAAHALCSKYKGRLIGHDVRDAASFSFYATKNLCTGEGGMFVTNNSEYAERAKRITSHGMSKNAWNRYTKGGSWRYDVVEPGYKYNMFDMQAAMGLVQLQRLGEMQEKRIAIAQKYNQAFAKIDAVESPFVPEYGEHSWHLYVLRVLPEMLTIDRDQFIEELNAVNIGTSVHFIPVHLMTTFVERYGTKPGDYPNAEKHFDRIISLPLYPTMTDEQVQYVIDAVAHIVEKYHK